MHMSDACMSSPGGLALPVSRQSRCNARLSGLLSRQGMKMPRTDARLHDDGLSRVCGRNELEVLDGG